MSGRAETDARTSDLGTLPECGPVPYIALDEDEARRMLDERRPEETVLWVHATSMEVAAIAARQGLIPSCWRGGDGCVVFGCASESDVRPVRGEVLVEIESRAAPGQQRAWWVPWWCIRGVWCDGEFVPAERLRERAAELVDGTRECSCELSRLVAEQQRLWRSTWLTTGGS